MLFVITIIFILYSVALFNRLAGIISLSLLGSGVIVSTIYVTFTHTWDELYIFANDYFYWLVDFIEYYSQPSPLFIMLTVIFLCIAASSIVYLFGVKKFVFPILLITGAAIFSIQWMCNFTTTLKPFYLFTFLILLYYLRFILNKKQTTGKNDYVLHPSLMLWMVPVCGIVILVASVVQVSAKPLEWKWLDEKVAKISDYFYQRFDYKSFDYFSVASSGFSQNDGSLGGRVRLNNTPVLKVKAPKRVYLRGSVMDIYTGTRWED